MFGNRVKIDEDLLRRAKQCAEREGYASVEEFIAHALEKEIARLNEGEQPGDDEAEVRRRLQGLGYIE
ncbi:MAG: hypothetical protein NTZ98_14025 [Acidobacteria bacterium]|nr:hypothetical protein [Acidobacteriota bacterium]